MIDLNAHAGTLGDPARYFLEARGRATPLVVEHATGLVRFTVDGSGNLRPYEASALGQMESGVKVENPPDFAGFPDHDRAAPEFDPATHGLDPAAYFVHFDAPAPLVVEHATGTPRFRIVDAQLAPLA